MKKIATYYLAHLILFTIALYVISFSTLVFYNKEYDDEGLTHGILNFMFYCLIPYFSIITLLSYKLFRTKNKNFLNTTLLFLFGVIPSIVLIWLFFLFFL